MVAPPVRSGSVWTWFYHPRIRKIGGGWGGRHIGVFFAGIGDNALISVAGRVNADNANAPQLTWFADNILYITPNFHLANFIAHQHGFLFVGTFQIEVRLRVAPISTGVRLMMLSKEVCSTEFLETPLALIRLFCCVGSNVFPEISRFAVQATAGIQGADIGLCTRHQSTRHVLRLLGSINIRRCADRIGHFVCPKTCGLQVRSRCRILNLDVGRKLLCKLLGDIRTKRTGYMRC
jgi:hypothetical protein